MEQPLSMPHEEKRKLSKGFQNGISPSDPSTQTLVKEVYIFFKLLYRILYNREDKHVINT